MLKKKKIFGQRERWIELPLIEIGKNTNEAEFLKQEERERIHFG